MITRPANRVLSIAARLMLASVFQTVRSMVEEGRWPLAALERDCVTATTKVTDN